MKQAISDLSWVLCPGCRAKTRVMIRDDTVLLNFPLFCPKCRRTFLIAAKHRQIDYQPEPDATTQSQTSGSTVGTVF